MAVAFRAAATAGNASGGNLACNKPTGTADGDILVAVLYREAGSWTLPAGWAQWGSDQRDAGNQLYLTVAWNRASSEGASWTFNLSATTWRIIAIAAFSGALASGDPIDVGPTGHAAALTDQHLTSITTTADADMCIGCAANYSGDALTAGASGYSLAGQLGGCGIVYLIKASAGATGDKSLSTASGSNWATFHLAIKIAAAGGSVPIAAIANHYRKLRAT